MPPSPIPTLSPKLSNAIANANTKANVDAHTKIQSLFSAVSNEDILNLINHLKSLKLERLSTRKELAKAVKIEVNDTQKERNEKEKIRKQVVEEYARAKFLETDELKFIKLHFLGKILDQRRFDIKIDRFMSDLRQRGFSVKKGDLNYGLDDELVELAKRKIEKLNETDKKKVQDAKNTVDLYCKGCTLVITKFPYEHESGIFPNS